MKDTASNAVIFSLIKENSLSIKEINQKVKTMPGKNFSYHSLYKALQKLVETGTIKRNQNKYSLSDQWIEKRLSFSDKLREHFDNKTSISKTDRDSQKTFRDIRSMNNFLRKLEQEHLPLFDKEHNGTIIWSVYHCYNYLLQPADELDYIKKLKESNIDFHVLCYGDTVLDRWTKKAFEKFGASMKTGAKVGGLTGFNIYDDVAIQIFYGKEFLSILQDIYKNTPSIDKLDLSELFEKLDSIKYEINVYIYKNKNIIKSLKERALYLLNQ